MSCELKRYHIILHPISSSTSSTSRFPFDYHFHIGNRRKKLNHEKKAKQQKKKIKLIQFHASRKKTRYTKIYKKNIETSPSFLFHYYFLILFICWEKNRRLEGQKIYFFLLSMFFGFNSSF